MAGKQKTPDQAAQAVILREAGYTLPTIAVRLGMSLSTTQRLLKRHRAVAGVTTQALIDKARQELINSTFALEEVQQAAASLAAEELSINQVIRMKLVESLESLDTSAANAPQACRALAALSTALKITQEVGRRALPLDKLDQHLDVEEMPVLEIHIMTADDVAEMRAQQQREEAEMNGDLEGVSDEIETQRWLADRKALQALQADDDNIVVEG